MGSHGSESRIGAGHPARAIWELVGRLELSAFEENVKSVEGEGGRARWPPRLLISVLGYAYAEGVGSVGSFPRLCIRPELGSSTFPYDSSIHYFSPVYPDAIHE